MESYDNKMDYILKSIGYDELLTQIAEEASELAQAALKLRRALGSGSWTPKTEEECRANFYEEIADVSLCINIMLNNKEIVETSEIMDRKLDRWVERTIAHENHKDDQNQVETT